MFISRMRISHKEWLALVWIVNPILNFLKNRFICRLRGNMNAHQARLSIGSIKDSWFSIDIIKRICKLRGHTEVNLLVTSKSRQVKVYFATLEDYQATALVTFTEAWNRFKPADVFPPRSQAHQLEERSVSPPGCIQGRKSTSWRTIRWGC